MNALLVDDNAFMMIIQSKLVAKLGAHITEANSGQAAIDCLNRNSFDFVLMDMMMPEMDGLETTRHIRQFNRQVIVIGLTGNHTEEDIQNCKQAGMNEVLAKPLDIMKLKNLLTGFGIFC
ncbi:response regulator [Thiomicrorhabdus indica]|uniref:response regulator n=1 Tax=Thiomicrorhabdus indica TaxID=2267253 RepID=UPI002AA81857|nr:response regulator [Thiomicrorhabdus indica]